VRELANAKVIQARERSRPLRKVTVSDQPHSQTVRQEIFLLLKEKEMTAREISQAIGIREREVYEHLPHVALSATAHKRRLVVLPFECLSCGYVFEERKRFTRPSRCPRCKKTHLETPVYRLV
jgi:predicted Zn-ribbon and HTH transcriptional regulator